MQTALPNTFTLFVDGASRGNPGDASVGCVCLDESQEEVFTISEVIGRATNNQAEYSALTKGLQMALKKKISHIEVKHQ